MFHYTQCGQSRALRNARERFEETAVKTDDCSKAVNSIDVKLERGRPRSGEDTAKNVVA